MKTKNCTMVSFYGNKADLSFVKKIRDIDVSKLDRLQKSKVEILLKLREAKKVVEMYKATIEEMVNSPFQKYVISAKSDIGQMEEYVETLKTRLREINLEILSEEEKNY